MDPAVSSLSISQLSAETGVHQSTIKYYISLGLVPRGRLVAKNRALYDESHVQRIQLIRALVTVGGVSIASVQDIVQALDGASLTHVLSAVQNAVRDDQEEAQAQDETLALVRQAIGIDSGDPLFHHPSVKRLAAAIDASRPALGEDLEDWVEGLIAAGRQAAKADLALVGAAGNSEAAARYAAVGIPLGDVVLAQARRLWQSALTTDAYGAGPVHPE